MASHRELPELMQTLPQELFDVVYEYTFTAAPGERVVGPRHGVYSAAWATITPYLFQMEYGHHLASDYSDKIDCGYLFPAGDSRALLHVDRKSRQKYANSYFHGEGISFSCGSECGMSAFLQGLDPQHAGLIEQIWLTSVPPGLGCISKLGADFNAEDWLRSPRSVNALGEKFEW